MLIEYKFVSANSVERAYARAVRAQEEQDWYWPLAGMKAAKARDTKFMSVLEQAAEVMHQLQEDQARDTRREGKTMAEKTEFTEYQLFREAFKMADAGNHQTMEHFLWIYGAIGHMIGICS